VRPHFISHFCCGIRSCTNPTGHFTLFHTFSHHTIRSLKRGFAGVAQCPGFPPIDKNIDQIVEAQGAHLVDLLAERLSNDQFKSRSFSDFLYQKYSQQPDGFKPNDHLDSFA
jgi:hypothetical protein